MPGLNFAFAFKEPIESKSSDYKAALNKTLLEDSHNICDLFKDEQLLSSFTSHDGYPTRTFENNGTKFYIEGRIYNLDDDAVNEKISSITERLFQGDETAKPDLSNWLSTADGEFIIFAYNKSLNRILVVNDIFGLLPCYIHKTDWGVVFSRNFNFVSTMVEQKKFDKIAMAQFMLLSHTIGDRTYLKDVYRPRPAELITIDAGSGDVRRQVLFTYNFQEKKYRNRSTKTNAAELARLFTEGCRNRLKPQEKSMLYLSGGLDSRATAAALKLLGADFEAWTLLDVNGIASTDYKIAQQVASELDVEWKPLKLKPMSGKNVLRTLNTKGGVEYLGKVFLFQAHDAILSDHGHKVQAFIGIGGDIIGHDITTAGSKKMDSLKDFLQRAPSFIPFKTISKLTGVSEEQFFDAVKEEFNSYPEKSLKQKYIHFAIYGQTYQWHFQGHDILRSFFWPASPFFSTPFFTYIMNCTDKQKRYLRLFYYFLNSLNPAMSDMPCARNLFLTPVQLKRSRSLIWYWYCSALAMCRRIRRWPNPIRFIYKKIKKLLSKPSQGAKEKFEHSPELMKCMTEQIASCSQNTDYLNWSEVEDLVKNKENYTPETLYLVFTIVSMIEQQTTGKSTLEKYQDSTFGSFMPTLYEADPTENY